MEEEKEIAEEGNNFDEGWKEIIGEYFPQLMEFFFPEIHKDIDYTKDYEFLDIELQKIVKLSNLGKRWADRLIKVYLHNGHEKWILIHIEIQGYYDNEFTKRMYVYNYRIFDCYGIEVISLAILADDQESFRPNRYEVAYWGFRHTFEFPTVKLLDYLKKWEELEKSTNPFGIVVMAHLKSLQTKNNDSERLFWKITLVKRLYEKGYSKEDVLNLYRFIDWVIGLPKELKRQFNDEVIKYEEGKKMPFITTAESIGIEKGIEKGREEGRNEGRKEGLREAIDLGLKLKFGLDGLELMPEVEKIISIERLRLVKEAIVIASELEEVKRIVRH
ncbi:MAG: cytosolic protein [bacterium]